MKKTFTTLIDQIIRYKLSKNNIFQWIGIAIFILFTSIFYISSPLGAAPLDEFLVADPGYPPGRGEVEVVWDMMNDYVDLFNVKKADPRGDHIGNFSGGHVRAGISLSERIWIDGALWKNGITTPYADEENLTIQGGIQLRLTQNIDWLPAMAIRVSGWKDTGDDVYKGSPTSLQLNGYTVTADTVQITNPSDQQAQLDLIMTWKIGDNIGFSIFGGAGRSKVDFSDLNSASITVNWPDGSYIQLPDFSLTSTSFLSDEKKSLLKSTIAYDASYKQMGTMIQWTGEKWRTRWGYRFMSLDRDVDEIIAMIGKNIYDTNHTLSAEVGYRFTDSLGIFVRGKVMKNQFVGEVPMSYNAFSSHKFEDPYGIVSIGLSGGF
ncbi:MAG: hypothetical protein H7832_01550 [Magnetococcus sp. DMHC-6]